MSEAELTYGPYDIELTDIPGLGPKSADTLKEGGISTPGNLMEATLAEIEGIGLTRSTAKKLREGVLSLFPDYYSSFIEEQTLVRAGLISAPVTPQTELEKRMVEASERRLELEEQVGADAWRLGTILGLNKISGEGAKDALITLGDAADKAGENILKTFGLGEEPPVNPYANMTQDDYLKLSSEGFSGSTAPGYSMPAPVIIQDQSVRQGGNQNTTINQMNTPVESHDTSWYQRRAAIGLGF